MAAQNGTFRRVWSQQGRRRAGGKEKAPVPGNTSPAGWRQTERAIVQPGLPEQCTCLSLAGAGDFLGPRGRFPRPQKWAETHVRAMMAA